MEVASEKSRDFASSVLSGIAYANLIAGTMAAWVAHSQRHPVLSHVECATAIGAGPTSSLCNH